MDSLPADLGQRIRVLRNEQGLTLAELSERSGVPVSTLSKIENGQVRNTSADNLFKIARGLSVLFDNLADPRPARQAVTGRRVITRASETEAYRTEIYDYHVHASELLKKRMVPFRMEIKTREVPAAQDWSHHEGEEWVFVVEGAIDLHTEHYAPARLEKGDSAYFDSTMRHCFVNAGEGSAVVLSVCLADVRTFPQGDALAEQAQAKRKSAVPA